MALEAEVYFLPSPVITGYEYRAWRDRTADMCCRISHSAGGYNLKEDVIPCTE